MKKRFPDLFIRETEAEKRPDVSVTAAGRAILSWLQAPDRLMDPENEKARELYSFLSSDEAKAKEMEDLAKAWPILIRKAASAGRRRESSTEHF